MLDALEKITKRDDNFPTDTISPEMEKRKVLVQMKSGGRRRKKRLLFSPTYYQGLLV